MDRLLTIVITATLTSAIWIVFGSAFMDAAEGSAPGAPADLAAPVAEPRGPAPTPQTTTPSAIAPNDAPPSAKPPIPAAISAPRTTALSMPVGGASAKDLKDSFFDPRGANDVRRHEAIDIMAPKGTLVTAAAPGRIAKIHRSEVGGKSIYVRSKDKTRLYFYAHLDAYANGLKEGARVNIGDPLGTVGTTGNPDADTPHLHFAVFQTTKDAQWWEPANAINPYPLLTEPVD